MEADISRSEEMVLYQLFLQPEAAYGTLAELGDMGCAQFRDLNSHVNTFQRAHVAEVRRCQDLERRIRYITNEMEKDSIKLMELEEDDEPQPPLPKDLVILEAKLENIEAELRELDQYAINLKENFLKMTELREVLKRTGTFLAETPLDASIHLMNEMDIDGQQQGEQQQQQQSHLSFVAGVIQLEKYFAFERMLWRISRGNIFLKRSDLPTTNGTNEGSRIKDQYQWTVPKTVFIAFFQGVQLKQRIKKVVEGFHASIYSCPSNHRERSTMITNVEANIEELQLVLSTSMEQRSRVLMAATRNIPLWSIMIKKMKAIYHCMNMFSMDVSSKCMIGECWLPARDIFMLRSALNIGSEMGDCTIPSFMNILNVNEPSTSPSPPPPTYYRTNKFTQGFQNLIDAYGIASYREVNPALYTCITFPFLFAVMFGDLGHGLILLVFALALICNEKRIRHLKGEIFNIFFGGRYIILLMGLFSLYTGLIYNDIFSKSLNIFGSSWHIYPWTKEDINQSAAHIQMNPSNQVSGVYAIGLDPIWQLADNKIIFLNTYKMKLSIIFGVLHMIFGVCLSLLNCIYKRKYINIMLEFVPQIVFLLLLFGYMVFMMFLKWFLYSAKTNDLIRTPYCAPSILILFINMMLFKHQQPPNGCQEYMFNGQETLQMVFVMVAILCIPWMLCGKPIYHLIRTRSAKRSSTHTTTTRSRSQSKGELHRPSSGSYEIAIELATTMERKQSRGATTPDHNEDSMAEVCIQQAIHTIEYVLSTVSHTASYLRLWALSLAHAQLSEVLWKMVFAATFSIQEWYGGIFLVGIFAFWAALTVGILVLIEGLSAFLHTLRLHWVEFMSKFYEGLGYAFEPFCFRTLLDNKQDE